MKVIISGAGIAGLSLAHWLSRIGATPVVLERAPRFQPLGHYISLKGNGVEMVRRMGIFDACEARSAPLEEVRLYSAASGRYLRSEHSATLAKTLGGYILLRRADLQSALHDLTAEHADIRFGIEILRTRPDANQVEVTLSDGTTEIGDLLVGADGIHSAVRGLAFGSGFERPLGGYYIAITQRVHHGLDPVVHTYLGTGRMVNLLPVSPDSVSAVVYLGADVDAPPRNDVLAMRDHLLATCADFPDEVHNVLADLGTDDFVFADAIAQIDLPRISQDRVALVGDAAHCPTFLSGMGTSLALQDTHILAGSLARSRDNVAEGLSRYEEVMAPIARRYRDSAASAHAALLTSSQVKARIRDLALRVIPDRVFERGMRRFYDSERPLANLPGP